ncbi:hypothetical protein H2201_000088 [Coniosporium apollinis]|uniref:Epoxide hydrolase N-terminal domain-containing protein n=1 Tax=Coniosporium apollinis TaxID=61459 RepID=A0ABQ9P559_9PEZI|nr:hypothetical protein H2201_000088 [Coniosporium apollinis]
MSQIEPFNPAVPQDEVDRLWRKLRDTRLPKDPIVPDAGEDYGPSIEWIHKLYNIWVNDYSWATAAETINSWHHYTTELEGLRIHFVHERADTASSAKPAIPLLLVHGWPGSFYEFSRIIGPLTHPSSTEQPAFDVVVPSMPGYCWSQGPPRDFTLQDTARVFDQLMKRLGYDKYVAQGGDWGHWVVRELGARYSDSCVALHTNLCPTAPPPGEEPNEQEKIGEERMKWFTGEPGNETHMAYAIAMRTRPQTIGVAFSDNPVGIMMWVGEKYNEITDPSLKDLQNERFNHDVLTTICLYYFTSPSIMTSMLSYYNNVRHEQYVEFDTKEENYIKSPFAFSSFRWDIGPTSERAVARTGNLKWYKWRDYGGHFAALETPDEFVSDLREFFPQWYRQ